MNIFQIEQDLINIFNEVEDNEGELTPELEEKLAITESTFKDKVKSYSDVIKMLTSDVNTIKDEIIRLKDLQTSKEKTINRLKDILTRAIETFGSTTKAGGKFIDYGTGKVSVRYTQAIEVDDDSTDRFVNRLITSAKWYANNNQLDIGIVKPEDIIDYINDKSIDEEDDNIEVNRFELKDIDKLNASIDLDINVKNLISTKNGIDLLRALLNYNVFKIKCKADKKALKEEAKGENSYIPSYAKVVTNRTISIK